MNSLLMILIVWLFITNFLWMCSVVLALVSLAEYRHMLDRYRRLL